MNNFKRFFLIFLLLIFFIFFSIFSYAKTVSTDLENNIFRLHILANSNSIEDQSLKLKIRDNIINYLENLCINCSSKSEYISIIEKNIENLKAITTQAIIENGYNYSINIEIGNFYFPTKHYGNISYPAGFYDGLKIKIGEAEGQNWWCSLFPPLCFTDISSGIIDDNTRKNLENNISSEEFNIISSNNTIYKIKFKLIEFLNEKNIL